jgi:DeoR family transcriptional regulator, deoxyribose operon repressor
VTIFATFVILVTLMTPTIVRFETCVKIPSPDLLQFHQNPIYWSTETMTQKMRERLALVVDTLQVRGTSSVHELAAALEVSEMTVRRDLELLARDDLVRLFRSGAALTAPAERAAEPRYSLTEAGATHVEEKMRIGRAAAALVHPGDIIILDSGSTTECLARSLPADIDATVICFALNLLVEANKRKSCRLVFAGGALHENTLMFESPESVQLIRRYRANTAFMSASGASERLGVTCANTYEVDTKKAALASSLRRVLLADSSKFGTIRPAHFAELGDFDLVITDTGLPEEVAERIRALRVDLMVV